MPGLKTVNTWTPVEIRGPGNESLFLITNCTVEEGQNLTAGTIVGPRPVNGKYIAYNKDAAASATVPDADDENTGNATCSTVTVDDEKTLTEDITVTFTEATAFTVTGSVSGALGTGSTGAEFSDETGKIAFTITAGNTPMAEDDVFTFSTTAAGARVATGIIKENVDATDEDKISGKYVKGVFITDKLTGLDADAKTHLGAKEDGDYLVI